ncbi:unnamed protein product [Diamesa serratosioi]
MCRARCITHQGKVISATGSHNHPPHVKNGSRDYGNDNINSGINSLSQAMTNQNIQMPSSSASTSAMVNQQQMNFTTVQNTGNNNFSMTNILNSQITDPMDPNAIAIQHQQNLNQLNSSVHITPIMNTAALTTPNDNQGNTNNMQIQQ